MSTITTTLLTKLDMDMTSSAINQISSEKYTKGLVKKEEPVSGDSRSSTPNSSNVSGSQGSSRSSSAASQMSNKNSKKNRKGVPKQLIPMTPPPVEPSFNWAIAFRAPGVVAAPVSCFKHVPVSHVWDNVTEGMKVEVRNSDVNPDQYRVAFWVASVVRICGYNVLLRFEGFGNDASRDFWANLCTSYVHPVGWCATKGKPLMPPSIIASKYADWRDFLVGRLTGARTLPQNLQSKVQNALSSKFEVGMRLEVVDKNKISRVRLAMVKATIGRRLHLMYFDSNDDRDEIGFWCHEESPLIHLPGWAVTVGHEILAPASYNPRTIPSSVFKTTPPNFAFFKVGMKLEVIDPLNLSAICAGTVKRVLKHGYMMVRVDFYEEDPHGADWFCQHVSSPNIFYCGFAKLNNISLVPPLGYNNKNVFNWDNYFKETRTSPAPLRSIGQDQVFPHNLKEGMKLEAADLMDPRLICVATVGRVVGSLLKIHFDGWQDEYDQWLDASSPDIYPVGYCELVGHKLEKPPATVVPKKTPKVAKKGRKKGSGVKRPATTSAEISMEKKPKLSATPPAAKAKSLQSVVASAKQLPAGLAQKPSVRQSSSASVEVVGRARSSRTPPEVKPTLPITAKIDSNDKVKVPSKVEKQVPTGTPESKVQASSDAAADTGVKQEDVMNTASSNVNDNAEDADDKTPTIAIPKLTNALFFNADMPGVDPDSWSIEDVGMFLTVNECGTYCDSFAHNNMDGPKLLTLTKDQIIVLTKMKVGPAVKILDLIGHLKRIANHARARKENKNKVPA